MGAVEVTLRCALAAVFVVAAVGKLLDLDGSRRALGDFGVPVPLARIGGLALPLCELAVAAALVIGPTVRAGAVAALLLLGAFVAGVGRAMARGERPDCHCFGQIHSEPAGVGTLVRNAGLMAAAGFIVVSGGGGSVDGEVGRLNATQLGLVATSLAVALLSLVVLELWLDRRRLERELADAIAAQAVPGLKRGTPAPEFELTPIRGTATSLADFDPVARPTVLVFLSTWCVPCTELFPSLGRWQESLRERLNLVAIFSGERLEIERLSDEHRLGPVLAQRASEVSELYALHVTPSAVQVETDRTIAGPPAAGAAAIEALIRSVLARAELESVLVR